MKGTKQVPNQRVYLQEEEKSPEYLQLNGYIYIKSYSKIK